MTKDRYTDAASDTRACSPDGEYETRRGLPIEADLRIAKLEREAAELRSANELLKAIAGYFAADVQQRDAPRNEHG